MKDFVSFLAGAIFVEEMLADDDAAAPAPSPAPDEAAPADPGDDPDSK